MESKELDLKCSERQKLPTVTILVGALACIVKHLGQTGVLLLVPTSNLRSMSHREATTNSDEFWEFRANQELFVAQHVDICRKRPPVPLCK